MPSYENKMCISLLKFVKFWTFKYNLKINQQYIQKRDIAQFPLYIEPHKQRVL